MFYFSRKNYFDIFQYFLRLCGGKLYDEESCMLACPMDCHMSPWSDWGLCDTVCGSGLKNRTSKVRLCNSL